MNRRTFLTVGGSMVGALALTGLPRRSAAIPGLALDEPPIKAILFDAFPIFDPGNIGVSAEQLFPGRGRELIDSWRTKQFEYTWLRTISGSYIDFFTIISDALYFASDRLSLPLSEKDHRVLLEEYYHLQAWPEAPEALRQLAASGYCLGFLSNFTPEMLKVNADRCRIGGYFSHLLSVDRVKKYKPASQAYQIGTDTLRLDKRNVLFVAHAGWDAYGAVQFGYQTFWVNRGRAPQERLGVFPDHAGKDLNDLLDYLHSLNG